jgi:hypothetical protein
MPNEPWYHKTPQALHTSELSSMCHTCLRINFEWLLCYDLAATIRRRDAQQAPPRSSMVGLPLGSQRIWLGLRVIALSAA